jgi:hypothetical protein
MKDPGLTVGLLRLQAMERVGHAPAVREGERHARTPFVAALLRRTDEN